MWVFSSGWFKDACSWLKEGSPGVRTKDIILGSINFFHDNTTVFILTTSTPSIETVPAKLYTKLLCKKNVMRKYCFLGEGKLKNLHQTIKIFRQRKTR